MTQFVYGARNVVLALGCAMHDDIPTPFVGFVQRWDGMDPVQMSHGQEGAAQSVAEIEAKGGTVVWFNTPEDAEAFHKSLSYLFDFAQAGTWGDKEKVTVQ